MNCQDEGKERDVPELRKRNTVLVARVQTKLHRLPATFLIFSRCRAARGQYQPVSLFAELASAHVVDGTEAELVRARWDEATNSNPGRLWFNVGQQHCPRGI